MDRDTPSQLPAIASSAMLRDNQKGGHRLLWVQEVTDSTVTATDVRTGRLTRFKRARVDGSPRGFSVVPEDEVQAALRRMRDLRLGPRFANVIHLSDYAADRRSRRRDESKDG